MSSTGYRVHADRAEQQAEKPADNPFDDIAGCQAGDDGQGNGLIGQAGFGLDQPLAFPDANEDGRAVAYFADFAPGYTVEFAPWAEVERTADGDVVLRSALRFKEE